MIGRIKGQLLESNPPRIVVDVHGVGYEIDVPMSTFYNLPSLGSEVTLLTHMIVREDAQLLYGFLTAQERETFRQLLKVSGIGARTALSILSGLSVSDLVNAVALQQASLLTRVPGIGKKTAERLILELKDKLTGTLSDVTVTTPNSVTADIINALIGLGYSEREANLAVKKLPEDIFCFRRYSYGPTKYLIRKALCKRLNGLSRQNLLLRMKKMLTAPCVRLDLLTMLVNPKRVSNYQSLFRQLNPVTKPLTTF